MQTSRLLFISALPQCGDYSRAATIQSADVAATVYFSSTAMRRLFEGGYYSKYRHNGYYIYFSATAMRRLFEGGYYSRCDVYSRKDGICVFCLSVCLSLCQSLCVCVSSFMSEFLRVNYSTPHCGKNLYSRKCPTVIP